MDHTVRPMVFVPQSLFFCAIGGSGMMPLALIMKALGHNVSGSDRGFDQGRAQPSKAFLESRGIRIFPQDGSGVTDSISRLIVSTAVEPDVPDYRMARQKDVAIVHRAALLAEVFNAAGRRIAIGGTSGKSTTTAMIAWILSRAGMRPTVMNGAGMKNFASSDAPFSGALCGDPALFVSEVDESDGTIGLFNPSIAVLTNIGVDHKGMDELRVLFGRFVDKAGAVVVNADNEEAARIAPPRAITFSLRDPAATLYADALVFEPDGARFSIVDATTRQSVAVRLPLIGRYNVANALAAVGASMALGIGFEAAVRALESFEGTSRRMEKVGQTNGVVVYDDFAHNPDKIAESLKALHQFNGRLLVFFQPHGYGPLKLLREGLVDSFACELRAADRLHLVEPLYLGGTVTREVTSADLATALDKRGVRVTLHPSREEAAQALGAEAEEGDRLVVMGARDDTLSAFARGLLEQVARAPQRKRG